MFQTILNGYSQFSCIIVKVINCLDKISAALNSNFNAIITIVSYQSCNGIVYFIDCYYCFSVVSRKNLSNIRSLTGFEY